MRALDGKVALVTGAGRGIGFATAKLFAEQGAKVVLVDVDEMVLMEAALQLRTYGTQIDVVAGDLTDELVISQVASSVGRLHGDLDILVNNAGYTWDGMLHQVTNEQWQAMLDIHVTAPFRLIRKLSPFMRDRARQEMEETGTTKHRKIINVSSTSGTHGNIGQVNYATAKAGVVGMTKTIAREWGRFHINCNAVAFGFIDTRLTQDKSLGETYQGNIPLGIPKEIRHRAEQNIPLGRAGDVSEAAGAIFLLASPWSNYITGQVLEVNGGSHL